MYSLKNKNVLIIGGLGLIGQATTKKFLSLKANVVCLDIKHNNYKELKNFKKFDNFYYHKLDISKTENLEKKLKFIFNRYFSPEIFVNCSYPREKYFNKSSFDKIKLENYKRHIEIHMNSYVWISKIVAEHMKKKKIKGSIINLSSIYGMVAQDLSVYKGTKIGENLSYSVIKSGIINYTRLLASYYGQFNIRANVICPGGIENNNNKNIQKKMFRKKYLEKTPLKRFAYPEDVANSIVFLSSDDASYITGVTLPIDGGWTAI